VSCTAQRWKAASSEPQLNDWDQYESVTAAGIYLHRGVQVLRMVMGAEDFIDFQGLAITADQ
jgi:hypothetical protein